MTLQSPRSRAGAFVGSLQNIAVATPETPAGDPKPIPSYHLCEAPGLMRHLSTDQFSALSPSVVYQPSVSSTPAEAETAVA